MLINLLKSKIHRATVTRVDMDYEGSIAVDTDLLDSVGLIPYEQVDVLNITNGERLTTYVIPAERGSGMISVQGAAAHKANVNDLVIICSYCQVDSVQAVKHKPKTCLVDKENKIVKTNFHK